MGVVIELASGVTVEAHGDWELPWEPRLALRELTLMVGPYGSEIVHEGHVAGTVGSGSGCCPDGDEVRFDGGSRLADLVSVCFHIPGNNADQQCSAWLETPARPARLCMADPRGFVLARTEQRWMTDGGEALLCLRSRAPEGSRERVRIAHHVDLLVAGGRFAGWAVEHPERFLVSAWELPSGEAPDRDLAVLLREYFQIVSDRNVALLKNGDPGVRQMLESLRSRVNDTAGATARRKVLRDSIEATFNTVGNT
ncbi:hypothetical protein LX15_004872 [Streptoalloteichus tenebrarius]|uniref:Uncharacterized protein n=1 Tax=Streptoalloteichus tenebrarius (strain ATCC 17920 / DSM 40477 / JCM 4838 / CBS 697.72 / NBRC 16177 / NCIMB 11028 / NRRL B-12390 / A12253. 1 / ISP 5477) TaxID=1933 RepID=A0ABT1I043_STRSD|nr:hypothetical protein [Streptoalloteichus tenebrarius]MCP2261152.1 hypothetical protein [Streptoalloteichus tenebrarius]BFF03935.1 hypothetical protein GCM10020241_56100 [Streptoalloteichus tenebrarius]